MKKTIKTAVCMILVCNFLCIQALAKPEWPADTGIQAESGIVIDADSRTVLFGQNIHEKYPPASILKLLTALVVIEHANLDDMVTFSHDAVYNVEEGSGNKLGLEEEDRLSVRECLYAMVLSSSNQAANALAEHVGKSREGFVAMMNEKAAAIGCTESNFANPSGLNDDSQLTTAYDMAMIAAAAFENPTLLEIATTTSYKLSPTQNYEGGITAQLEHKLVITEDASSENYYPDAVAGKTGWTSKAGNTLVTYASRDGRNLIAVILKSSQTHYSDTISMLEFGFNSFANMDIAENEISYTTGAEPVAVGASSYQPSELTMKGEGVITLPKGTTFADAEKSLDTELPGDHPENAVAVIQYTYNERKIGRAFLCLKEAPAPETETQPAAGEPQKENGEKEGSWKPFAAVAAVIAILAAGGAGVGYYIHLKKEEEKRLALRRERRRQRLAEEGSAEEFERLLAQRLGSSEKESKNPRTRR